MKTPTKVEPTVGRIVHYYAGGPDEESIGPFAAIITSVVPASDHLQLVDLIVFFPGTAGKYKPGVPASAVPAKHTWSWPPGS